MFRHWTRCLGYVGLLLGMLLQPAVLAGQSATPVGASEGITLAASGLENPRGFTWGSDGTLYIAQAGGDPVTNGTPASGDGRWIGTLSGSVVRVTSDCPVIFQDDLPSAGGTGGIDLGPAAVAVLSGQVYVLDEGGGSAHGNPLTPDGIYAIDGSGSVRLVADIGAWVGANPVANPPDDLDPNGDVVAMVAAANALWVVESNSGQVLRVTTNGEITRVADLSEGAMRPSGLVAAPDGSVYVSFQTRAPYREGVASVVNVATDGTVTEVWTGLTAATSIALGPDGTLYALELGTPDESHPLGVAPDSGRVLRQTGFDTAQEVAVGIDTPLALAFGPDQMLYVSTPAITTTGPTGAILRLDLAQGEVMTMSPSVLASSPCLPTPTPSPDATTVTTPTPGAGTPAPGTPDAPTGGVAVTIANFAFNPGSVTVAAGTTVTWTNNDTVSHTVTSTDGAFDSGNIAPGETFTFTFSATGTFTYMCSYHPNMTATVVVQ